MDTLGDPRSALFARARDGLGSPPSPRPAGCGRRTPKALVRSSTLREEASQCLVMRRGRRPIVYRLRGVRVPYEALYTGAKVASESPKLAKRVRFLPGMRGARPMGGHEAGSLEMRVRSPRAPRADRPKGRCLVRTEEMPVRVRLGPLRPRPSARLTPWYGDRASSTLAVGSVSPVPLGESATL